MDCRIPTCYDKVRTKGFSLLALLSTYSFGFLQGFAPYLRHLVSQSRLPFTLAYFGSMILTLYFAVGLHNLILTIITSVIQIAALLSFFISYVVRIY
jgi:hypothetical protein